MPTDTTGGRTQAMHRRGHRKSRNGCIECKRRHIKVCLSVHPPPPSASILRKHRQRFLAQKLSQCLCFRFHISCPLTLCSHSVTRLTQHVYNAMQRSFAVCMRQEPLGWHEPQLRLNLNQYLEMAHQAPLMLSRTHQTTYSPDYRIHQLQMPTSQCQEEQTTISQ